MRSKSNGLFEKCGITLVSTYSGNSSIDDFANSHTADLNLIMCHRSINYVAEMMEKKFGVPWIKSTLSARQGHGQVPAQNRPVLR
jgi:nitrogenase molybdenum-iron protein alpha/beta subunit